eukprot:s527_g10.t1
MEMDGSSGAEDRGPAIDADRWGAFCAERSREEAAMTGDGWGALGDRGWGLVVGRRGRGSSRERTRSWMSRVGKLWKRRNWTGAPGAERSREDWDGRVPNVRAGDSHGWGWVGALGVECPREMIGMGEEFWVPRNCGRMRAEGVNGDLGAEFWREDTTVDGDGWRALGSERSREDAAVDGDGEDTIIDGMEREDAVIDGDGWEDAVMDGDGRGVLGIECSWEDVVMDGDGWELWGVAARSSEDTDIDRNGWGVLGAERSREDAAVDEMEREDVAMEGDAWEVLVSRMQSWMEMWRALGAEHLWQDEVVVDGDGWEFWDAAVDGDLGVERSREDVVEDVEVWVLNARARTWSWMGTGGEF